MPYSLEDKHTIKVLRREQKLYGATKILRMFPNKNWTLSRVKTVLINGWRKRLTASVAAGGGHFKQSL